MCNVAISTVLMYCFVTLVRLSLVTNKGYLLTYLLTYLGRYRVSVAAHNNNNNNIHDDIYSAVITTEVIARVHSVHLVNGEQCQVAADPQTKPPDLGCESAGCTLLSSTTTIAIYYYYSP